MLSVNYEKLKRSPTISASEMMSFGGKINCIFPHSVAAVNRYKVFIGCSDITSNNPSQNIVR